MSFELPTALVIGLEMFGARDLAKELGRKDIRLVSESEIENYKEVDYIFDFRGEIDWSGISLDDRVRLTLVAVNSLDMGRKMEMLVASLEGDWRVVEAVGVYGPGVDKSEMVGVELLKSAIDLAILNQNLILPGVGNKVRLMAVSDLVEAVLRTTFLRGVERERILVAGEEVGMEELARVLIDEAKMTRTKIRVEDVGLREIDGLLVEENWNKLRWRPEVKFGDGIKETLQYFFNKVEEERRTGKKSPETGAVVVKNERQGRILEEVEVVMNVEKEVERVEIKDVVEKVETEEVGEMEEQVGKKIDFDLKNLVPAYSDEMTETKEAERVLEIKDKALVNREAVETVAGIVKVKVRSGWWRWLWLSLCGLGCGIVITWLIWWWWSGIESVMAVEKTGKLIIDKKYELAVSLAENKINRISVIDREIDNLGLNRLSVVRNYQSILRAAREALVVETKLVGLIGGGEEIKMAMFGEREIDWDVSLGEVEMALADVYQSVGRLEARLGGNWSFVPTDWRRKIQGVAKRMSEEKEKLRMGEEIVRIMPELLGLDGRRRDYLVLLQNEAELRPSGGFIGSYGILSFESGRLLGFEVRDVYEADGQLKGHVEPPEEIKKYLGEAGWYMRDANWQASFPGAVKDIVWFFEKEMGRRVDGVIGVNLAVARGVLSAVGEVEVVDFKQKINEDNLYEQAEFYSENKFFPGSKQKASFLGALSKRLFEEMRNLSIDKWGILAGEMISKLEENEIQVVLNDKKGMAVMSQMGWDGAMYGGRCADSYCMADYLYVVEANLGVNKANYFVYRKIEEVVDISNNVVERVVKISYENTAKSSNQPGGDYKNYMRVYVPSNVDLTEVSVSDANKSGTKRIYGANELKIQTVGDKKEIGMLVIVPVGQGRIVELRYRTSFELKGDKFSYLNYIQKQSGFGETGIVALVSFPDGWQPVQVQPAASVVGGKLLFNTKLDRDIKMGVEIGR